MNTEQTSQSIFTDDAVMVLFSITVATHMRMSY